MELDKKAKTIECMTVREFCTKTKLRLPKAYELIRLKKLRALRIGRQLRIRLEDAEDFLNESLERAAR